MVGRVELERYTVWDPDVGDVSIYRLVEGDGSPVVCWLPELEPPDPLGPLDRGGFESRHDARAFALGVDLIRSEAGLTAETPEQIEAERAELDRWPGRPVTAAAELEDDAELEPPIAFSFAVA